jgi:hypothetical protein
MAGTDFAVRDHFLSVFQSAVTQIAKDSTKASNQKASLIEAAGKIANLRVDKSSDVVPIGSFAASVERIGEPESCVTLGLKYFEASATGDNTTAKRIADELSESTCDSNWIKTLTQYLGYFGPNGTPSVIPYVRAGSVGGRTIPIPANAKIGLIGDWGTGRDRARSVLEQVKACEPDLIIHLGDVYYSGTSEEYQDNFTQIFNEVFERDKRDFPVFTLAGNHDMCSGGKGYYSTVANLNKGTSKQGASFFCLRSADAAWQFLAMDTGYHDYNPFNVSDVVTFLEEDEQKWHLQRLNEFAGRTILLSHHQLFSAFSAIRATTATGVHVPYNPRLLETFKQFTAAKSQIAAWFWGHEHTLSIYEHDYLGLRRGRCLGHGAIPVLARDNPYTPIKKAGKLPKLVAGSQLSLDADAYANGFAMVTLAEHPAPIVEYYQVAGGGEKIARL